MNWSNETLLGANGSTPNLSSNYNGTIMVSPKLSDIRPAERGHHLSGWHRYLR